MRRQFDKRLRVASSLAIAFGLSLAASPAQAEFVNGDNPGILVAVSFGSLAGLTTSIAATVYAVQGKTFDSGWIFPALFGSAVTTTMTISLIADAADRGFSTGHGVGIAALLLLTTWPTYWTLRTAIADVDPGEYLEPELDPELEAEVSLQPPPDAVMVPVFAINF